RTPDEILTEAGDLPTPEAIRELFINCSSWDEEHDAVSEPSKQALIDLGEIAVATLCEYLPSQNVLKRVTLDEIIRGIGSPSQRFLLIYLDSDDMFTRRHAAYLIGDVSAAMEFEDMYALGPVATDMAAIAALKSGMQDEGDWHVKRMMIESLGKMKDPAQIQFLSAFLNDQEEGIRLSTVTALGYIPSQEAAVQLIRAFADGRVNVRQAAVMALSTEVMGNLGFEPLVGCIRLSPAGLTGQQCALEALTGYLQEISSIDSPLPNEHRARAYSSMVSVLTTPGIQTPWSLKGYLYFAVGYTYQPEAIGFLESRLDAEGHPFVIGKIREAIDILKAGRPAEIE
ncbi:MAG TPA: HEAT repeat domain-containing protein, partial [bacterium]